VTTHLFNQREKRALFVGLDLETTSTDSSRARIVQFASVAHCPGFLPPEGSVANFLLDPGCAIPTDATKVHGITDEMVRGKLTFDQNLPQLMQLLHMATQPGAIVTGYNVRRYDWPLLQHTLAERGIVVPTPTFVDVCDLIGWYYRHLPSRKLTAVAEHLGVGFAASGAVQSVLSPAVGHVVSDVLTPRPDVVHAPDRTQSPVPLAGEWKQDHAPDRAHDALGDVNKTFQVLAKIRQALDLADNMAGDVELIRLSTLASIRLDAEYGQYRHYIYRDRARWSEDDAPFRLGFAVQGKHCGDLLTDIWRDDLSLWNWLTRKVVPDAPKEVKEEFRRAFELAADRESAAKGGTQ
jgi:hypothetical protein